MLRGRDGLAADSYRIRTPLHRARSWNVLPANRAQAPSTWSFDMSFRWPYITASSIAGPEASPRSFTEASRGSPFLHAC
ncbi:Hypothetical protein MexAM1_META2p0602 (plasmid) [Methylorubrum extorquens AM1]|uniref:Uncharacterized protein n=1 Tax=Methylorubrum extorquens (strain ATCC 14718 / DSM 1338 / JCM 2805 / NCIMB 9133 / AM1) TaxID=272630 RepID=C5B4R7_METEA|nr:Hypothetical protein MexAM1_META2p0602 [Methylorubrum extorquens AM1]